MLYGCPEVEKALKVLRKKVIEALSPVDAVLKAAKLHGQYCEGVPCKAKVINQQGPDSYEVMVEYGDTGFYVKWFHVKSADCPTLKRSRRNLIWT